MKKYTLICSFVLLSALLHVNPALSQTITVGTPIEDAYRREQLLGRVDSNVSFTIRPLYPQAAFGKANIFDLYNDKDNNGSNGIYKTKDGNGVVQLMPITWQQQYNTHNPYGWNDGAMIPAAGYQSLLRLGVFAKYKFISIQLQPEFVYAQNKDFDGFTQAGNEFKAWGAWYYLHNRIDMPERFGTGAYSKILPGQSSIRFTLDPVSLGLSTENIWWGPGVRNSLLMSNNATGFAHITLNTTRPINTIVGSFETQLIAGKLTASGYPPTTLGQPGNRDDLNIPKTNDWRYLSGIVLTYHPKWVPGLFLGATRAFTSYHKDMGSGFKAYFPFFGGYTKSDYYDPTTGVDTEDQVKRDQLTSIFARWLLTGANAEVYFEYGREDHSWDTRDLLLDPEHSRAYILGFKKLFKVGSKPDEHLQVSVEQTQLGYPANDIVNRPSTPSWYANNQVRDGYTNNGQVLGAGIGPGGALTSLDVSWIKGIKKIGLIVERYEHDQDIYYKAFAVGEVRRHWVDYSVGLNSDWNYKHFLLSARIIYIDQLNYQWKFKDDPSVFYWSQKHFDANNFQFGLNVSYFF